MQRSFSADITVKVSKETKNVVSIIPFSDSDKRIAKTLEKVLNQSLKYDEYIDYDSDDCFRKLTNELR